MGKIWKKLWDEESAAIGIGAMIVFIAMVLVAGIAASVLIQTAGNLQMQAMSTGQETESEVATGLAVTDIEGHVASGAINYMTISIKPRAGSKEIDLDEAVMEISDTSIKVVLKYPGEVHYASSVSGSGVFNTSGVFNVSNTQFGLIELEDADNSCSGSQPVINRGDLVMLTVNCTACFGNLSARTDVWGQVIPEEGAPAVFAFRVPASLTDTVYDLY